MLKLIFPKISYLNQLIRLKDKPVFELIRQTASKNWGLILINVGSSLFESLSEGASLAILFIIVEVLSSPVASSFDFTNHKFLQKLPLLSSFLSGLSFQSLVFFLLGLALIVQLIQSISRFLNSLSLGYFAAKCRTSVTWRIHKQVLSLSYPCASSYKIGDLTDYANQGPEAIRIFIENSSSVFVLVLLCLTYIIVLVSISPWLLVAAIGIGSVIVQLQRFLLPRIAIGSEAISIEQVSINSTITENFQALRLLHSSGQLVPSIESLRFALLKLESHLKRQAPRMALLTPVSIFLPILAISIVGMLSVVVLGNKGALILPSLVTFVLSLQRLTVRLNMLGNLLNNLADNSGRLRRLNSLLSPSNKQFLRKSNLPFKTFKKSIRFESVSLNYNSNSLPAVSNVSFTIHKNSKVALVGESGAGKSSIADLLIGLYEPSSGSIFVDDTPLAILDLSSWQSRLGVVSQDTFMFNRSIAENVSYSKQDASLDRVKSACNIACADTFIESLPLKYDTIVGERGYRLSGGQRQRLSIARSILHEPDLIIFDEATSALDSETEQTLQGLFKKSSLSTTLIVIAHRLSTIYDSDLILVFNKGSIVERGKHQDLLSARGHYYRLWAMQNDII